MRAQSAPFIASASLRPRPTPPFPVCRPGTTVPVPTSPPPVGRWTARRVASPAPSAQDTPTIGLGTEYIPGPLDVRATWATAVTLYASR